MNLRHTWTLRARLLALTAILLTSMSMVVGTATIASYRSASAARLEAAVEDALSRATLAMRNAPGLYDDRVTPTLVLSVPGQQAGTVAALRTRAGGVQAGLIGVGGEVVELRPPLADRLTDVPVDGHPRQVDLADLGTYLVVAARATVLPDVDIVVALPVRDVDAATTQLSLTVGISCALALLVGIGLGAVLVRRAFRPLTRVTELAERVSRLPLDRAEALLAQNSGKLDEHTEVGRLSAAVSRMFGRITTALADRELSERRTQRFVADASHELRTPLATIRGYAEFGRVYDPDLTSRTRTALARIEDEAIRMAELVEELLVLARLDAGQELDVQRSDAGSIVAAAVASESHRGSDHVWRLQIPEDPAFVDADPVRLRQAVSELLSNAHVHSPAGSTVCVTLTQDRSHVHLVVSDDGPGIPINLVDSLFGRFVRADQARNRRSGSTGLGLSLAKAIIEAHRGSLELVSASRPTIFRISLPRADAPL